jgi:hypothetical protein
MRAMVDLRFAHEFDCSDETFWTRLFLDDRFNEWLYKDRLGFSEWKVVERQDTEHGVRRVVDVAPPVGDLPGPLQKLIGGNVRYREHDEYDAVRRLCRVDVVPGTLADKVTVRGEIACLKLGEARCRRIFAGQVEARIFGVGALLEKRIASELERSYEAGARFMSDYIRDNGL